MDNNLFGNPELNERTKYKERFLVSPYSVLNSTTQDWLRRKQYWFNRISLMCNDYSKYPDTVLYEVLIKWYTEPKHSVLDLYTIGVASGFVTCSLGRKFTGILSGAETGSNVDYAKVLKKAKFRGYRYMDGMNSYVVSRTGVQTKDFVIMSPEWEDFEDGDFNHLAQQTYRSLKSNRFACVVLSDYRYLKYVLTTMEISGYQLYDELVYIKPVGIQKIRSGQSMSTFRRTGKVHNTVLVFYKGDTTKIKDEFSEL